MQTIKLSQDSGIVGVRDLDEAGAYYACVFEAELITPRNTVTVREMMIGDQCYQLVCDKDVPAGTDMPVHHAPVRDVDLCVARAATKGARIVGHPCATDDGPREGQVIDPFGHLWVLQGI